MGEDSKATKAQIIVAIIGLVGVLATAVIANLDKISSFFAHRPPDNTKVIQTSSSSHEATPPPTNALTVADAELLMGQFVAAFNRRDSDAIIKMISVPFYFGKEEFWSSDEARQRFDKFFADRAQEPQPHVEISGVNGQTVADLRNSLEGRSSEMDSLLRDLRMKDQDFVVSVSSLKGSLVFIRHDDSLCTMAPL